MDINTLRGLATLFVTIAFLSIFFWAYSGRRKEDFKEAAALPFAEDDDHEISPIKNDEALLNSANDKNKKEGGTLV
ncbi:MAG: cbb3-type cytochrome c oxidase subunit 3 [Candidatus Endonucleobacter bathymodioli]|uniref:Cbb3-type cytochrome c oxidase subunit 3 n=1 Tax=Candidatus Endonucleibacter bathymodioli TaxID=539814 RepID=A0AA90P058_9GAMM|nr:cbb3-type cytochrome c oxidase subunit 3 [Candidatus Endonucleobacter bathymodioli]